MSGKRVYPIVSKNTLYALFGRKRTKPSKKMHRLPQRKEFLTLCVPIQGVREGEGESGVASRLHGFEGAAEVGEGAHRLCGVDL